MAHPCFDGASCFVRVRNGVFGEPIHGKSAIRGRVFILKKTAFGCFDRDGGDDFCHPFRL